MEYISFDIETIPGDFEELSSSQQEYLLRGATTEEEIAKKKGEMALTALTGKVVCIGMARCGFNDDGLPVVINKVALSVKPDNFSLESSELTPLEQSGDATDAAYKFQLNDDTWCFLADEAWVLKTFWAKLIEYKDNALISFNGRGFDAPYLMHRSAIFRIRPSRNLMEGTKFNYNKHIDLLDELTFYSPSNSGPTRRFNFDFYARAFGIHSPKSEGVDGSMVSVLFKEGKIKEISEYCMRDVIATWELFVFWNEYLNFKR